MFNILSKFFKKSNKNKSKKFNFNFRPMILSLEDRTVPSITFTGGWFHSGTAWNTASNWMDDTTHQNRVPTSTDDVNINSTAPTVNTSGSVTVKTISIQGQATLNIVNGGDFTTTNGGNCTGTIALGANHFNMTGGTFHGNNTVFTASSSSALVHVDTAGTLSVEGSVTTQAPLTNDGTITFTGGAASMKFQKYTGSSADYITFTNDSCGTINFNSTNADIFADNSPFYVYLKNYGVMVQDKVSGAPETDITANVFNSGAGLIENITGLLIFHTWRESLPNYTVYNDVDAVVKLHASNLGEDDTFTYFTFVTQNDVETNQGLCNAGTLDLDLSKNYTTGSVVVNIIGSIINTDHANITYLGDPAVVIVSQSDGDLHFTEYSRLRLGVNHTTVKANKWVCWDGQISFTGNNTVLELTGETGTKVAGNHYTFLESATAMDGDFGNYSLNGMTIYRWISGLIEEIKS